MVDTPAITLIVAPFLGLTSLLILGGCSFNGYGIVAVEVERADGALLYTHHAPGLQIRTRPDDVGASLGFTRRACIGLLGANSPASGWYFGFAPPSPHCYASDRTTWGGELRVAPPDLSLGIGLRQTVVLAQVEYTENVDYELSYDSQHTPATRLNLRGMQLP